MEDRLDFFRTELNAELAKELNLKWVFEYRKASQNFDHYYGGSIVSGNKLRQNYAKQETDNETISNAFTLTKELNFERFKHNIAVGYDNSIETRHPRLWYSRTHTHQEAVGRQTETSRSRPTTNIARSITACFSRT